jgi:hypothetical protein
MTAHGLVSGQLAALAQAYDSWKIPTDAVAIVADVSPSLWLPHIAVEASPSLLESALAIQQGFRILPAGTPAGFIAQQADVSGSLLSNLQQHIHSSVWIEAGEDPIACARLAPQSQGVLLGKVIEKNTSPTGGSTASPGIDVPKLEHWVRGLQHTFHQQAAANSATNEAPCQPISQPLS